MKAIHISNTESKSAHAEPPLISIVGLLILISGLIVGLMASSLVTIMLAGIIGWIVLLVSYVKYTKGYRRHVWVIISLVFIWFYICMLLSF